jgi:competence protein ComEC
VLRCHICVRSVGPVHGRGEALAAWGRETQLLLLGALVAGLLVATAPRLLAVGVAGAAALAAIVLWARPLLAAGLGLAVLAGAAGGHARLAALDHTALGPFLGEAVSVRAVLLEAPRVRRFSTWTAPARIVAGPGRRERIVLRGRGRPPGAVETEPVADAPLDPSGARSGEPPAGSRTGHAASGSGGAGAGSATGRADDGRAHGGIGAEVLARGTLERLEPWESYEARRGAHAALEAGQIRLTGRWRGGLAGVIDRIRRTAEQGVSAGLPPPQAALARGMVLGQDDALDEETREAFRASGLSHVLAASGQNVALLAVLAAALVMVLGGGRRLRLVAALALVALYVPLAGAGPSIQRAGVMGGAALVAGLAGRPASRVYALLLAAAVTLALNPRAAGDPGWQLSFAAVVAIAVLVPRLKAARAMRRLPGPVADGAAMTIAATLGTAPLLALHFERLSLAALPANLVAMPAVAPVVWLGTLAGALAQLGPPGAAVASAVNAVAALPLGFVGFVASTAAHLPHASVPLALGVPAAIGAYVVIAAAVASRRARAALTGAAIALVLGTAALTATARAPAPPAEPTVSFLDVGQGDATLFQDGDAAILVDTGPPDGPIVERLRAAGVRRLDLLVLTHGEIDHAGAADRVLRAFPAAAVLDGTATAPAGDQPAIETAIADSGAQRLTPAAGQRLRVGALDLRVLWPPAEPPSPGGPPNDRAVVLLVRRGPASLLLTADAESPVTAPLGLPPVDVLKVAHHGSADPGLPALLDRLRPSIAAIEVGAGNSYGHPAPETLAALRGAHVPRVVRTDRDGTVRLTLDDDEIRIAAEDGG